MPKVNRMKIDKEIEKIQEAYIKLRKEEDKPNKNNAFKLFSLDARDLEVLDNIESGSFEFKEAEKLLKEADKENNLLKIKEAKRIMNNAIKLRKKVVKEKSKEKEGHAINQLEI